MIDLAPQALWGRPVVIGGGVAGAVAALTLSPMPTVLVDPVPVGREAASRWAQGGLAAAVGADDSPELQAADTVAAGAGLTDATVAAHIAAEGPATVEALERFGVHFDRDVAGHLALGLEAAHCRRRILHVRDATGSAIVEALGERLLATPSVEVITAGAARLLVADAGIVGVVIQQNGKSVLLPTMAVVLATGGIGGLWQSTTNPVGARGAGLALAGRAGAVLADLEFMQFHPTALAVGADPMPLVSEAVRGEGAVLVDAEGRRFMDSTPGGDLAPRDIVARAVFAQWSKGGSAALDVRHFAPGGFAARFPNIHRVLTEFGIDPETMPIPVRPAAHYHMGGVKAGVTGRTSIEGLWAAGEVACTGLHGANRLASNSLLEAAVCGRLAAEEIGGITFRSTAPVQAEGPALRADGTAIFAALREVMNRDVGVVRDGHGLTRAIETLGNLRRQAAGTVAEDAVAIASLIADAALRRTESRGAHFRSDAGPQEEPATHSQSHWQSVA
jgi:L-aspartate oxidase